MANITLIHDCDVERRDSPTALNGDFRDTYINANPGAEDTNYDSALMAVGLWVPSGKGSEFEQRGLHLYDLNAFIPASATITAAVWWFYISSIDPEVNASYQIDRCTRTNWKEDEATWNSYVTGSAWTAPGGDMDTPVVVFGAHATSGWKNYDILTMVDDAWDNRSGICTFIHRRVDDWMVGEAATQGYVQYRPKNYHGTNPAVIHHLRITYTLAGKTFQAFVFDSGIIFVFEELSGTIEAVSSLSGEVFRTRPIGGLVEGVSSLSASLHRTRPISGQIDGVSTLSGSLYRTRPLSGQIDAVAALSANLYLTWALSGTIPAVSALIGNLNPYRGLSGSIDAVAALVGSIVRTRNLWGGVAAVSFLAGDLYVVWCLQGTIEGEAYLVATLESVIAEPVRPPRGQALGTESLVATSRLIEGLAAQGISVTPIPPGRGKVVGTPSATGRSSRLPSGLASGQDVPRPGSAGVAEGVVGHGVSPAIPLGKGVGAAGAPTNFDENPSFETDLNCVSVANGTISRSDAKARYGSYSCRAEQASAWLKVFKRRQDASMQPVVAGETYIHSAFAQMETGDGLALVYAGIDWYDAEENWLSFTSASDLVFDDSWSVLSCSATAPESAAFAVPYVEGSTGFSNGEAVYIDGQEFRRADSYISPYIDGDQEGCYWIGAPHASASERTPSLALHRGTAKAERTKEGEAETDRPPPSGKAR